MHLSRDEKTLYVNDTNGIESFAFDIRPDGRLSNREVFATHAGRTPPLGATEGVASGADDLVIDGEGRVYSITAAGIEVFSETGQPIGIIPVTCTAAGARCQALAFGGGPATQLSGTAIRCVDANNQPLDDQDATTNGYQSPEVQIKHSTITCTITFTDP